MFFSYMFDTVNDDNDKMIGITDSSVEQKVEFAEKSFEWCKDESSLRGRQFCEFFYSQAHDYRKKAEMEKTEHNLVIRVQPEVQEEMWMPDIAFIPDVKYSS